MAEPLEPIEQPRASALAGHYDTGKFGAGEEPGVIVQEVPGLILHQVAAWPDTVEPVARRIADTIGAERALAPCRAVSSATGSALRVEPVKWWLVGVRAPRMDAGEGVTLDLSHSRTRLRVTGADATQFLNRFLPLDLRESMFPLDSVASSAINHVGVTLWRSAAGYEIFIPRGFALALWQGFVEVGKQFGVEVR